MIFRGYENGQWDLKNGFISPSTTEEEVLKQDLYQIIRKADYMHRNNSIAGSISRVMSEYAGATGYRLDTPNSDQQAYFDNWSNSCTTRGDNWNSFRRQRITGIVEGGGVLVLFTQNPDRKKGEVGLRLEVIQGGRVCTPPEFKDSVPKSGIRVELGIAYNSFGSEVGYYYKDGDSYKYVSKYNDLGMLNAYFERSPDAEKPTSGRTLPMINIVMTQVELCAKIEKNMGNWAEKVSVLGAFVETDKPQEVLSGFGLVNKDDNTLATQTILDQTSIEGDVRPNMIGVAPLGTKMHLVTPEGSANFDPIFTKLERRIASGVGIISTILFGDTDGKNFATSKFEAQTFIKKITNWGRSLNFLDTIIAVQVWQEANIRKIANFDLDATITWGGSADFEGVDASKSADASGKRVTNGQTTKSYEASKLGHDYSDNIDVTMSEITMIKEKAEEAGHTYAEYQAHINNEPLSIGVSVSAEKEEEEDDGN